MAPVSYQDGTSPLSIYDLFDLRRVPYRQTMGEIRARFEPETARFGSHVALRGLEPLIVSMTEPLEIDVSAKREGDLPRKFSGRVIVHGDAMSNFAEAKAGLADLLGRGFDPRRGYRRDRVEWWWYGGIVQIETTVR